MYIIFQPNDNVTFRFFCFYLLYFNMGLSQDFYANVLLFFIHFHMQLSSYVFHANNDTQRLKDQCTTLKAYKLKIARLVRKYGSMKHLLEKDIIRNNLSGLEVYRTDKRFVFFLLLAHLLFSLFFFYGSIIYNSLL